MCNSKWKLIKIIKIFPKNCQNMWKEKLGIVLGFYI